MRTTLQLYARPPQEHIVRTERSFDPLRDSAMRRLAPTLAVLATISVLLPADWQRLSRYALAGLLRGFEAGRHPSRSCARITGGLGMGGVLSPNSMTRVLQNVLQRKHPNN